VPTKGAKEAEPPTKEANGSSAEDTREKHEARLATREPLRRWWVGVGAHFDFVQMPQGTDLCRLNPNTALPANSLNVFCYAPGLGTDFPPHSAAGKVQNNELQPGTAGTSNGGVVLANVRLYASLDYALNANVLIGARAGIVLLQYPGTQAAADGYGFSAPVYLEARVTGVFAKDGLTNDGIAPIAFAGAGVSSFDGHASGTATLCPTMSTTACAATMPTTVNVDMWRTNGPAFIDFGGGVRYAPTARYALIGALRANLSFGGNGLIPTIGPEIDAQMGF